MKRTRGVELCVVLILLAMLLPPVVPAAAAPGIGSHDRDFKPKTLGQIPVFFEANQGQFDETVRFASRIGGNIFFFTPEEMAVILAREKANAPIPVSDASSLEEGLEQESLAGPREATELLALQIRFVGAAPGTRIEGQESLPGKVNYFVGNDPAGWQKGVPTYGSILYRDLYPETDLRYYGAEGKLKYDFVLHPGADVRRIVLAYAGAEKLRVNDLGQLEIVTAWGTLLEEAPLAWQPTESGERIPVVARYQLRPGGELGFEVGAYEPSQPLVIDPALNYSTFVGGSDKDLCHDLALSSGGNVMITGATKSKNFPTSYGAYDGAHNGDKDVYVFKLSSDGSSLMYSTFIGGGQDDEGYGVTVDSDGHAVVTGFTWSSNFPTTPGAYEETYQSGRDGFVLKLSTSGGSLMYSTFLGGSDLDATYTVALDSQENPVVAGFTSSPDFPTSNGAYDSIHNGTKDVYVLKLTYDGSSLMYGTFIGGSGEDIGRSLALDAMGNAVLSGYTYSANFPTTPGAYSQAHGGSEDAFVLKLSVDGRSLLFSTFLGGNGNERGRGLALDNAGRAVIGGYTTSPNFPTTAGAYNRDHQGAADVFVLKLASDGKSLLYSTLAGGKKDDKGLAIALDQDGNSLVVGNTSSSDFPTTSSAYDQGYNGNGDVYVIKLSADGSSLMYSTFVGGSDSEQAHGVESTGTGSVVVAGRTSSSNFPTTSGAYDGGSNGDVDAFVFRLDGLEPGGEYSLTVNVVGGGMVVREPDKTTYETGETVKLTAIAQAGWEFDHWGGSLSGSSNPTTINMNGNKSAIAYFSQVCYELTTRGRPAGSGWVGVSPAPNCGGDQYSSGTQVQLMASAGLGYRFDYWDGDASGRSNPTFITMDQSKSVTAYFFEHGNGHSTAAYMPLLLRGYPLIPIINGGFETGNLTGWQTSGDQVLPAPRVIARDPYRGTYHLLLGAQDYCQTPDPDSPGDHSSVASQIIRVPNKPGTPKLMFRYRIFTYDHLTYTDGKKLSDSLDVYVGGQLALRDNYENYPNKAPKCESLQDSGWRTLGNCWFQQGPPQSLGVENLGVLDLTEWKGRSVEVRFELKTRHDGWFNTWAYLDDVSLSGILEGQ